MDNARTYLCIDLKSFYASVECAERGLDPFTTNLVVADPSRTEKTICLAITPAMKDQGVANRCRVFEIPDTIDYIMAKPRMQRYMEVSAQIYGIYLRYISPEDIHVYSIDEVFIDATPYLTLYGVSVRELAVMLMDAVFADTGICATAGIGTNLFLAKVALDITAKHVPDHIGVLDEESYRRLIGPHRPITDIWNVGPGIARRLAKYHVFDMDGVAHMDEQLLYREFGVNAEYLIDHAHGVEPCTIADIHAFEPEGSSMTNGQVLACDYTFDEAHMVMREMLDISTLEMVDKHIACARISLRIGYAKDAQTGLIDHSGGSRTLSQHTNSYKSLCRSFDALYDETTQRDTPIRRIALGFSNLLDEDLVQVDLFSQIDDSNEEHARAQAVLAVKKRFGKNALIRGMSLNDKATARDRNNQVGGHNAR